jgi:hypothetical protein
MGSSLHGHERNVPTVRILIFPVRLVAITNKGWRSIQVPLVFADLANYAVFNNRIAMAQAWRGDRAQPPGIIFVKQLTPTELLLLGQLANCHDLLVVIVVSPQVVIPN